MAADYYWSLDDFINAFIAGLRLRPNLAEIQIEDTWPGDAQQQTSIWVDDASCFQEDPRMRADPARYSEVYSVYTICDVYKEGGTTREARAELTTLVGEVMAFISESKRVEVANNQVVMARLAGWKYRPYVLKDGRGVACRIETKVSGRR